MGGSWAWSSSIRERADSTSATVKERYGVDLDIPFSFAA
jgi:hypothetical protein